MCVCFFGRARAGFACEGIHHKWCGRDDGAGGTYCGGARKNALAVIFYAGSLAHAARHRTKPNFCGFLREIALEENWFGRCVWCSLRFGFALTSLDSRAGVRFCYLWLSYVGRTTRIWCSRVLQAFIWIMESCFFNVHACALLKLMGMIFMLLKTTNSETYKHT